MSDHSTGGFFEDLLMIVGGIVGAIWGYETGGGWGLIIGAAILGGIGKWVGTVADWFVKLALLIVLLLLNAAVRQFIWSIIESIF